MSGEAIFLEATPTTVVSVAANMTNGQVAGCNAILDNSTNKYLYAKATLDVPGGFATAPTSDNLFELWMIRQDVDASNNDDTAGSSVTSTPATPSNGFQSSQGAELVGVFPVSQTTSGQRITREIEFDSAVLKAKFFLRNQTGVTANGSGGSPITVAVTPFTKGPAP